MVDKVEGAEDVDEESKSSEKVWGHPQRHQAHDPVPKRLSGGGMGHNGGIKERRIRRLPHTSA